MPSHSNPRISSHRQAQTKKFSNRHDVWNTLLSRAERRAPKPESHLYLPYDTGEDHLRYSFEDHLINHNLEVDAVFRIPLREPVRKKRKAAKRCRPRQSVPPVQPLEVVSVASTPQRDDESDSVLMEVPTLSSTHETSSSDSRALRRKELPREVIPKPISASERLKNDCHLFGQKPRQPFLHIPSQWQSPKRSKRRLSKTTPISTRASAIPSEESTKPDSSVLCGSDNLEQPRSRDLCDDSSDKARLDEYCTNGGEAFGNADDDGDRHTVKQGTQSQIRPQPHRRKRARLLSLSSSSSSQSENSEPEFVPRRKPKLASRKSLMVLPGASRRKDLDFRSDRATVLRSTSREVTHSQQVSLVRSGSSIELCTDEPRSSVTSRYHDNSLKLDASISRIGNENGIKQNRPRGPTNSKGDLSDTGNKDVPLQINVTGDRRSKRHSRPSECAQAPTSHDNQYLSQKNGISASNDDKALRTQAGYGRSGTPVQPREGIMENTVLIDADDTQYTMDYVVTISSDSDPSDSTPKVGFRNNLKGSASMSGSSLEVDEDVRISGLSEGSDEQDSQDSSTIHLSRVLLKLRIKEPRNGEGSGSSTRQAVAVKRKAMYKPSGVLSPVRASSKPRSAKHLDSDNDVTHRNGSTGRWSPSRRKHHKLRQVKELKLRRSLRRQSDESTESHHAKVPRFPSTLLDNGSQDAKAKEKRRNVRNKQGLRKRVAVPTDGSMSSPNTRSRRLTSLRSAQNVSSTSGSEGIWENGSPSVVAVEILDDSNSDQCKSSSGASSPIPRRRRSAKKKSSPAQRPSRSRWTKKVSPNRTTRKRTREETNALTGKSLSSDSNEAGDRQDPAAKKRKVERDPASQETPEQAPCKVLTSVSMRQHVSAKSDRDEELECEAPSQNAASRGSPIRISRKALHTLSSVYYDGIRTPVAEVESENRERRRKARRRTVNGTRRSGRLRRQSMLSPCGKHACAMKNSCTCRFPR